MLVSEQTCLGVASPYERTRESATYLELLVLTSSVRGAVGEEGIPGDGDSFMPSPHTFVCCIWFMSA